jgi:hypothetical protein
MTIFGRIVTGSHVEDAAEATLRLWIPTYIAEIERQTGRDAGTLPTPRSWSLVSEFGLDPEDQFPAIVIESPGLVESPGRDGRGTYRAAWDLRIGVVVAARDERATRRLSTTYAAAIQAALLQHPSLGGFAADTSWLDTRYTPIADDAGRTLAAGRTYFRVDVDDVVTAKAGPAVPNVDPLDPYDPTTAETVVVDLRRKD